MEMMEMQVLYLAGIRPAAERLYKDMRHASHAAEVDVTVGLDVADCLVGGHESDFFHRDMIGISYCGECKDTIFFVIL
jgi:hypothetical protein